MILDAGPPLVGVSAADDFVFEVTALGVLYDASSPGFSAVDVAVLADGRFLIRRTTLWVDAP